MIIDNGIMDRSMFEFQMEMVDMNSKITLETAMLEYGIISESENIFVKIKNGILNIIKKIKDFITTKLFGKHKSISNKSEDFLDQTRKNLEKAMEDLSNFDKIEASGPTIEGFEGKTVKVIGGIEEMYVQGVNNFIQKEMSTINKYTQQFNNPSNFKDKEAIQKYCNEFKENGEKLWFGSTEHQYAKSTADVTDALKLFDNSDAIFTHSDTLIKDGKLTYSIPDFKKYVDWLGMSQKEYIDANKKSIASLNNFITKFDNDVKRINIDPDKYKDLVSLFSQFCNTVTTKNSIQLAVVNGIMNLQIKRMNIIKQISVKIAAMSSKGDNKDENK